MSNLFFNSSTDIWSGITAFSSLANTIIIAITAWFIYRQVRTAVRASQFGGILKMQELVDEFREDRKNIFSTFPIELVTTSSQFPSRPPGRLIGHKISEGERRGMLLTDDQVKALNSLTEEQYELARKVIGKLNDLGELVEDGFIDYKVFLGKYHTMVIRLCHILEPIRRKIEEEGHGGSYGQRLLRMRHTAIIYNTISPKHRNVDLKITIQKNSKIIVSAIEGSLIQKLYWFFRRHFFFF